MDQKRPKSVTVLAVVVLSLLIINFTRFVSAIQQWDFLTSLPLSAPPAYLLITGLIWSLLSIVVLWGWTAGTSWTLQAVKGYAVLYSLYYWLEQWLVKSNPLKITNWPFMAALTIILLFLVFWISSSKAVKTYFGAINE